MLVGLDFFEDDLFTGKIYHFDYKRVEVYKGVIDHIYIDENINIPKSVEKPEEWMFTTVLNAKLNENLEGGSIEAGNKTIEKILFQRRKSDQLEWESITEIEYTRRDRVLYEAIDKFVANKEIYQYSIIPIASSILGNRVESKEVEANFEGLFISDNDSNYHLLYNLEYDAIENNISNATFAPQNAKYPIIVHSNLDYSSLGFTALFTSTESTKRENNEIDIRAEKLGRENFMNFLKNGKPKVYRNSSGILKLVSTIGNPVETPHDEISGLSNVSASFVEIGDMNGETLRANGLQISLTDVY